ncbi:MAG: acetyltransferase [Syntrophomonadaceae bacterium]|nr:acetyltransferase [Syntrophomonadaceae bacterium]
MAKESIVIIGAGGHGKVIASTAQEAGLVVEAFYDDDPKKHGNTILGVPVIGGLELLKARREVKAVIALGDNQARKEVARRYEDFCQWITVIHPRSYVHSTVKLGKGTVVFAGVSVQPDAIIGEHCIINTGVTIDHDCIINDFVHLGPGVHLAGNITIAEGTLLGVGTSVIPGVKVGKWSIIGVGAALVNDIPDHVVAAGVPARVIKNLK